MSKLGNYIHNSFEGYKEKGTFTTSQRSSNYNSSIFSNFKNKVLARVDSVPTIDIETIEKNFNKARNEKITAINALAKNDPSYILLIQKTLEAANLDQKFDAATVAKYLEVDATTQTLKLVNPASGGISPLKKLRGKDFSYLSTILSRCAQGFRIINTIQDPNLKASIHNKLQILTNQLTKLKNPATREAAIVDGLNITIKHTDKDVKIPSAPAGEILKKIESIIEAASVASVISSIQGGFEEVLGAIIGPNLQQFAETQAINTLQQALAAIANQSSQGLSKSTMGLSIVPKMELNQKYLQSQQKNHKYIVNTGSGDLTIELDYATQDKADFSLTYDGQDFGVSAKAYDLSREWDDKDKTPSGVSLQTGTNLLAYLLAVDRFETNMGNHFLNIFSVNNTNNDMGYVYLKNNARDALQIFLLYTALSGDLLKSQNNAQIFYVYNKSKKLPSGASRVHFFNIADIVKDIAKENYEKQLEMINITPTLDTLKIANTYIMETSSMSMKEAISTRITKVLLDARGIKYKIKLNNSYLNSIKT